MIHKVLCNNKYRSRAACDNSGAQKVVCVKRQRSQWFNLKTFPDGLWGEEISPCGVVCQRKSGVSLPFDNGGGNCW